MNEKTMGLMYNIVPFIILIAIMYFMLIRPQKKKDKEIASMRASLKTGDTIVTIGGIVGKIVKIKDDAVIIQVGADRVKMEIMKWAVSTVLEKKVGSNEPAPSKRPKSLKKDDAEKEIKVAETTEEPKAIEEATQEAETAEEK